MKSSTYKSIKFDRFVFGSTCRSIRPGLSDRTAKDRLQFIRRSFHVPNLMHKLGIVTTTAAPAVNRIRCYNQCFRLIFWLFCNSLIKNHFWGDFPMDFGLQGGTRKRKTKRTWVKILKD